MRPRYARVYGLGQIAHQFIDIRPTSCAKQTNNTSTWTQIIEAAKAANAHDFIMSFPDGYGTQVGQKGSQMSGGKCKLCVVVRTQGDE